MSHHLFLLSPSDTPIYSLSHQSLKPAPPSVNPLASNLPTWSTSAFAGTLSALSGATSAAYAQNAGSGASGSTRSGQDKHVIQMIANASLDVIEDVMRQDNGMYEMLYSYYICDCMGNTKQCSDLRTGRYMKTVDRFNEWTISAFVTPGSAFQSLKTS